jgi:IS5 family transposase
VTDFGRRSAIEPVISHLKHDFRLARNYLKGTIGDAINLLMAAAAFNCAKWMKAVAATLFFVLISLWATSCSEDARRPVKA